MWEWVVDYKNREGFRKQGPAGAFADAPRQRFPFADGWGSSLDSDVKTALLDMTRAEFDNLLTRFDL
jgi:hypothetical protein